MIATKSSRRGRSVHGSLDGLVVGYRIDMQAHRQAEFNLVAGTRFSVRHVTGGHESHDAQSLAGVLEFRTTLERNIEVTKA